MDVIELSRVSKVYRSGALEVAALRDVDMTVHDGEFVAKAVQGSAARIQRNTGLKALF